MKIIFLSLLISLPFAIAQTVPVAAPRPLPSAQPSTSPSPVLLASPSPQATDNPNIKSTPLTEADLSKSADLLAGVIEDYSYNPEGKRDPFLPFDATGDDVSGGMGPSFPLQKFDVDQLKLVGIIWGVSQPKAMLTDPTGRGHVVKVNDRMGRNNGYVARIREGELVIVESFKGVDGRVTYQTRIMKLGGE